MTTTDDLWWRLRSRGFAARTTDAVEAATGARVDLRRLDRAEEVVELAFLLDDVEQEDGRYDLDGLSGEHRERFEELLAKCVAPN